MDLLRFITAGSVDDGKSTLIGRLLYDSRNIFVDQLEALERHSRGRQANGIDLSLLTDGLRAEREQGITIDVAHRYFHTAERKFIIYDAPGHIQYTRNMVTGASNAQLIIILVDACHGVVEQTRRHAAVASLLNIPQVVVAINKMDMVGYSEERYEAIVGEFGEVAKSLQLRNVVNLPVSALLGDNIVERSVNMSWYEGMALLPLLETIRIGGDAGQAPGRLSVQYVVCPPHGIGEERRYAGREDRRYAGREERRYAGRISSGVFRKNGLVTILPVGLTSRVAGIEAAGREVTEAEAEQSVAIRLEDHFDISRGDLLVTGDAPQVSQDLELLVFWMDDKVLAPGNRYLLQVGTRSVRCIVEDIRYLLDITTMERRPMPVRAGLNDIVQVKIRTAAPVAYDRYRDVRANGCAILIDETSYATAGACIVT